MIEKEAANRLQSFSWALQGLTVGVVLIFLAMVNIDLGRIHIGFMFLPVIAIFFWPVQASYSWSLVSIFLLGLFHDMASDGPLGVWMLSYLLLFMIMGGGIGVKFGFRTSFLAFALSLIFIVLCLYMVGYASQGHFPDGIDIMLNCGAVLILFPLAYWLRTLFGKSPYGSSYRRNY